MKYSLCQLLIDELIVSKLLQVLLSQIWGKNIYGVFLFEDYVYSILQLHNCIRLLLSAVNGMNSKNLIRTNTVTKNTFFSAFCNIFHFIFQYFDSSSLICYLITYYLVICYNSVFLRNFNFLTNVCLVNYLFTWNLGVTLPI